MNETIIEKIITERIPCYFISPHLDDAVLSAGGLIAYLSQYTQVEGISVFTTASPRPYTFSVRQFLRQCGYEDADQLFTSRREEDREAYSLVNIVPRHLGYVDALWRKISTPGFFRRLFSHILPEFVHVYPTYRIHIVRGKISRHDEGLMHNLGEALKALIGEDKQCVVFCPIALRSHIDHIFIRDVCLKNFENVILWSDFPYNIRNAASAGEIEAIGNEVFKWDSQKDIKEKMIKAYTSQTKAIFPDGTIPLVQEVYYSPRKRISKTIKK